jgi:hypothetical protein
VICGVASASSATTTIERVAEAESAWTAIEDEEDEGRLVRSGDSVADGSADLPSAAPDEPAELIEPDRRPSKPESASSRSSTLI